MRVVMTGGGGFIGSNLLARMVGAGVDVTLIGSTTGKSRYTASLVSSGAVCFLRCDDSFSEEDVLAPALSSADALVLLGYTMPSSIAPAQRLAEEFARNVAPVVRLLRASEGGPRQVIFASSMSVYGAPASPTVSENEPPRPQTPYAIAKLACEESIAVVCAATGWTPCVLRYSTVFGAGETVPRAIPNFIRAALAGQPPIVNGDGSDVHDYVHVSDVAEATLSALRRKAAGLYNIGTGVGTMTLDLANLVLRLTGATVAPALVPIDRSAAAPVRIVCSTDLASSELGFTARRSLTQGLTEEIGWLRSQADGCATPALAASA
jgi:UDP-glucose 4-epimerase